MLSPNHYWLDCDDGDDDDDFDYGGHDDDFDTFFISPNGSTQKNR